MDVSIEDAEVYPRDAYSHTGELLWEVDAAHVNGRPLGDEVRISAWLAYNKKIGDSFTTEELRQALGSRLSKSSRNDNEHFQRRIRELRVRDGWSFPSNKQERSIPVGQYRLDEVGWHLGLGVDRPRKRSVSAKTKRQVLARDGSRCKLCGVGAGESYPGRPGSVARLTVGHVVPGVFGGRGDISNLRTECSECNEPAREDTAPPDSPAELMATVVNIRGADLRKLHDWMTSGQRGRDRVDEVFDRYRFMAPGDQEEVLARVRRMVGPA